MEPFLFIICIFIYMQSNEFSKMTHHEFDQTRDGWRKFGDDHKASIKAIFQFAKEKGWGENESGHVLLWHLFQLFAMENMNDKATKLLRHIIKSGNWNDYYSRGTLAFMNSDVDALKKEIDAAHSDAEYIKNAGNNIEILERMLNGIGKKYSEVY